MSEQSKQPNNEQQSIVAEIRKALALNKDASVNDLIAILKGKGFSDLQPGDLSKELDKIKASEAKDLEKGKAPEDKNIKENNSPSNPNNKEDATATNRIVAESIISGAVNLGGASVNNNNNGIGR